jgi:hypothetical protein
MTQQGEAKCEHLSHECWLMGPIGMACSHAVRVQGIRVPPCDLWPTEGFRQQGYD